jgi:hypothetical protein
LINDGSIVDQLSEAVDPRKHSIDLSHPPLIRYIIAQDNSKWVVVCLLHHIIGDHSTLEIMTNEIQAMLKSKGNNYAVLAIGITLQ